MTHSRERPVGVADVEVERHRTAFRARRDFLSGLAVAALSFLPWTRKAAAQVCYDQYGNPVTTAAAPAAVPAATPYYPPAAAVSGTRQVARRTARRTGRREGVREDAWDAID